MGGLASFHAGPAPLLALHAAEDSWAGGLKDLLPLFMLFDYWIKGNSPTEQ